MLVMIHRAFTENYLTDLIGLTVTELLAPKSKQPKHATKTPSDRNAAKGKAAFSVRDELGAYIAKPDRKSVV